MGDNKIRINKYLASIGVASRRKIDQLILQGKIQVNRKVLLTPGVKIDPIKDEILLDGKPIQKEEKLIYIALNKPKGIISSAADEHGRETVVSWVNHKERIFPVGRLDRFSTGLILLTNDGELALKLTHPRYQVPKTYQVRVHGQVSDEAIAQMEKGIKLKLFTTAPAKVKVLKEDKNSTLLEVTLREGKNREIRKMCGKLGLDVMNLDRVAIGPIKIDGLKIGEFRDLTSQEVAQLKNGL